MKPVNTGGAKGGRKTKPFSDFVLRNALCPGCGKRIDLLEIRENICPSCGSTLFVTNNKITELHQAVAESAKIKKEKKKKNQLQNRQSEEKKSSEPDEKYEIGTFFFVDDKYKEYMMIEKKRKSYLCLPVIPNTSYVEGQYVQKAYKDRLAVVSESMYILPAKIKRTKARLAVQYVNDIIEKYHDYVPKISTKGKKGFSGNANKQQSTNNYRRSGDGLYDGNAWSGLAMSAAHIKIYRG